MADIVILTLGPLWTLAEVKAHLNVVTDDEDDLIKTYMDAAEGAMLRFCNIDLVPYGKEAVFKVAGLLLVSSFYDNEPIVLSANSDSQVKSLIWPYRSGMAL